MSISNTVLKIAVGSTSELKRRAVQATFDAFGYNVEIVSNNINSGVGIQPIGMSEMEMGASNRAKGAQTAHPDAIYSIGIENGLVDQSGRWFDIPCIVVLGQKGTRSVVFGAGFPIPRGIVDRTIEGNTELGEVVKLISGGTEKDPMVYFSDGSIKREQVLTQAIQCALIPLISSGEYESGTDY